MARQEVDMRELKRHRAKKRLARGMKKLLIVLIIAAAAVGVYLTREHWLPFFDGIASRYMSTIQNDGTLAEGNFPLKLTGGVIYQSGELDNAFATLNDTHISIYDTDGGTLSTQQHNYANPIMRTSGRKALVYDSGGSGFRLQSKYKTVYEKSLQENIILARLSNNDSVAVITSNDQFVSIMTIYNGSGQEIYRWKSVEDRVIDVAFTSGGDGCAVTTCNVVSGRIVTSVYRFNFSKEEEQWHSETMSMLGLSGSFLSNGHLAVFGDTACYLLDKDGSIIGQYTYPAQLVGYGTSGDYAALLLENQQRRKGSLVTLDGEDFKELSQVTLETSGKQLLVSGSGAMVLTDRSVDAYSKQGTLAATAEVTPQYKSFRRVGNHIFLIAGESIDRIDFSG